MKLSQRITHLETRLGNPSEAFGFSAAQLAEELERKYLTIRERLLADPQRCPPWARRSPAEKWATAETPEQCAEAEALLAEALESGRESRRRCQEQAHRAMRRNLSGQAASYRSN